MTKLDWRSEEWGNTSYYDPLRDTVGISKGQVERGVGHLSLAHELAHRREGIFTSVFTESSDRVFWKELAVWESALKRKPYVSSDDRLFILDSLGSYIGGIADEYGYDSSEYQESLEGFDRFMRRYL